MISEGDNIKQYIKDIALNGVNLHSQLGFVEKVDTEKLTCTVRSADLSSVYTNVRLKEITQTDKVEQGIWLIPAENSRVIIDLIDMNQPYISMVSEVEKLVINIEDKNKVTFTKEEGLKVEVDKTVMEMQDTGFVVKTEKESLKTILSEILMQLSILTVPTPSGPSSIPNNKSEFDKIKDRLNDLFIE